MARRFSFVLGATVILCSAGTSILNAFSLPDLECIYFAYRHPTSGETLENSLSDYSRQGAVLEEALDLLKREPTIHVYVRGYADTAECLHANCQALSDRRAQLVYDWLLAHGVDQEQIEGRMGFSNFEPIDFEETEAQRMHNRRVEFGLTYGNVPASKPN